MSSTRRIRCRLLVARPGLRLGLLIINREERMPVLAMQHRLKFSQMAHWQRLLLPVGAKAYLPVHHACA